MDPRRAALALSLLAALTTACERDATEDPVAGASPTERASRTPSAAPTVPPRPVRPAGPPLLDAFAACSEIAPGTASPVTPRRDGLVRVTACLSGNDPPLEGFGREAAALLRVRWAEASPVSSRRGARCVDFRERGFGYLAVQTDRRQRFALSRSLCGFLTYRSSALRADIAVPVTFAELGIADDVRRVMTPPQS